MDATSQEDLALARTRTATQEIVAALAALVHPGDPERADKVAADLQTALRHTTNKHFLPHADFTRLESLSHACLKILCDEKFAALSPRRRSKFAIDTVIKTACLLMRNREYQLFTKENSESSISLRCGGRRGMSGEDNAWTQGTNKVAGESVGSDGGGVRHVLSRPDWKLAHAYEDALIEKIAAQRAGQEADGAPEGETRYEMTVRVLGVVNADFVLDYEFGSEQYRQRSPDRARRSDADRARYYRLKRQLLS